MSQHHTPSSEQPGFREKLGKKTKAIFVEEKTNTDTLENLQMTEYDNLIATYNTQLRYVEEAIKTNAPDFYPSIELAQLHRLRDQVDEFRAEETSLRESLLQKILLYFPVLLVLFPQDHTIGKQLRELLEEIQIGTLSHDAQAILTETEHIQKLPDTETFHLIQQLLNQHHERRLATQGALRQTLLSYQTTITELINKKNTQVLQFKNPEQFETEVIELIKNYEGWDLTRTNTPATDNFSVQLLMQSIQDYKAWYVTHAQKTIQQQDILKQTIEDVLLEYIEVITSAYRHLLHQQTKLRENYKKTTTDKQLPLAEKIILFKKTRTTSLSLWSTFVQDIGQTHNFLKGKITPAKQKEIDNFLLLDHQVFDYQQHAEQTLRQDFTTEFEAYQQTTNIHNLNKLHALQKALVQDYQNFLLRVDEFQELEQTLRNSGEQLSLIDTLRAIPHKPQLPFDSTKELGWTADQLVGLMTGFLTHMGITEMTIDNKLGDETFSTDEAQTLLQVMQKMVVEQFLDINSTQPDIAEKKYYLNYDVASQKILLRKNIPTSLNLFRADFRTEIKNTDRPLAEIIKMGEQMIADGEFLTSKRAGLQVSHFNLRSFIGSFATSDTLRDSCMENYPENISVVKYYSKLVPGPRNLVKLKAMPSKNIEERKEPMRTAMLSLERKGIKLVDKGDFRACIQALQYNKTGLTERDALTLYMYLTEQYGSYLMGPNEDTTHNFVWLGVAERYFATHEKNGYVSDRAFSLLFSVD